MEGTQAETLRLTHWCQDKIAAIFADDTLICIFLNENVFVSIAISRKFVPKGLINNIIALIQIMVLLGDKTLSELMMVSIVTHMCDTGSQRVNESPFQGYFPTTF